MTATTLFKAHPARRSGVPVCIVLLGMLWCAAAFPAVASGADGMQSGAPPSKVLLEGEELVYNVRYGFIDLGQVRIVITHAVHTSSYAAFQGKAVIDSYPKVPFVDLHAIYESLIDSAVFARFFVGKLKDKDHWDMSRYRFDYDRNRVLIEVADFDTIVTKRDTLSITTKYHDGLSLFFYARDQLFSHLKVNIPTLIKEEKVMTYIDFKGERSSVEVEGIDYPIDVVGFDGRADFVGIFGLTGGFEGWFSNDEARVPIMAKMKVLIGSVTIELMRWNRPGWTPPRARG
jgi:hypothetical protein